MYFNFRRTVIATFGVLIMFFAVRAAPAQSTTGQISGIVTDPSGASVPGASVSVTNTETHAKRDVKTDDSGNFIATNLPIGSYSISVSQTGFRTAQQQDISITADAKITANFALQIGQSTEVVEV